MTDPASTAPDRPPPRPGRRNPSLTPPSRGARADEWATPPRGPRRRPCGRTRPAASARPSRSGLGWLDAPASLREPDRRHSRASATPSVTRATRRRSSPGWAAAASPRTSCTGRSASSRATSTCASSTRPDPAYVAATLDDLDPLRTLVLIASEVRARRPSRTPSSPYAWERAEQAPQGRPRITPTSTRAPTSRRSPTPARASTPSPTTTTSARSSSTRPTSVVATAALTYVGLVPGVARSGIDLDPLLASAGERCWAPAANPDPASQPGVVAGARHRDARRAPDATS